MKVSQFCSLWLGAFLLLSFGAGDEKKATAAKDPYAELFGFPAKTKLEKTQKEKLAELRAEWEPKIAGLDKSLVDPNVKRTLQVQADIKRRRDKLARLIVRKKNAILTDEQRRILGLKGPIPAIAQAKALNDRKVWDLSQLEKVFTIESRSFDPDEQVISFMVITKRKWTDKERQADAMNWNWVGSTDSPVKVVFYNKHEEPCMLLSGPYTVGIRPPIAGDRGITRVSTKLTAKQEEEGLLRFRIRLDLDDYFASRKEEAASAKFYYPEPK